MTLPDAASALKIVFFDLDDTLCNTTGSNARRVRLAYEALAAHHPDLSWRGFRASVTRINPATGFWRGIPPAMRDLGLATSPAAAAAMGLWFFEGCPELLRTFRGARGVLRRLAANHRLGVITNGPGAVQRRKFQGLRLGVAFDVFVASEDIGYHKPDPEIFRWALRRAGVAAGEAVYVGDRADIDVLGARRAGLRSVWFNPRRLAPLPLDPAPDATIAAFRELAPLLDGWAQAPAAAAVSSAFMSR